MWYSRHSFWKKLGLKILTVEKKKVFYGNFKLWSWFSWRALDLKRPLVWSLGMQLSQGHKALSVDESQEALYVCSLCCDCHFCGEEVRATVIHKLYICTMCIYKEIYILSSEYDYTEKKFIVWLFFWVLIFNCFYLLERSPLVPPHDWWMYSLW